MGETRTEQEVRPAHLLASMREVEASLEHDVSRSPRASGLHTEMENLREAGGRRVGHNYLRWSFLTCHSWPSQSSALGLLGS